MVSTTARIRFHKQKPETCLCLFCSPYAGGGTSIFRTWAEDLPAAVDVCPVLLPGRDDRLLEVPFAFFGHSMGGLIAFELARELRRQ